MNILIDDLIFSLQQAGGISVYWSELMKRMNEIDIVNDYTCISTPTNKNMLSKKINWKKQIITESNLPIIVKRFLPIQHKLPLNSIFHSSYLRYSNQKNVTNIITIHDLAPEKDFIKSNRKYIRQWQQRKALQKADGIICVSDTIRNELLNYYSFLNPINVKTIYHGVSSSFYSIPKNISNEQPYILFVGDRSYYKNFELAVKIVQKTPNLKLIIVGGKMLNQQEKTLLHNNLTGKFECKAIVDSTELNILYNNAFCLLYPTSYEGFGLPILEAMKIGCPVVTTNKAAIPEIAGDAALQVKTLAVNDFVHAIESLLDEGLRNKLIAAGKLRALNFSWDRCFVETIDFYATILKQKVYV